MKQAERRTQINCFIIAVVSAIVTAYNKSHFSDSELQYIYEERKT